jgi:hypothetical protein
MNESEQGDCVEGMLVSRLHSFPGFVASDFQIGHSARVNPEEVVRTAQFY